MFGHQVAVGVNGAGLPSPGGPWRCYEGMLGVKDCLDKIEEAAGCNK